MSTPNGRAGTGRDPNAGRPLKGTNISGRRSAMVGKSKRYKEHIAHEESEKAMHNSWKDQERREKKGALEAQLSAKKEARRAAKEFAALAEMNATDPDSGAGAEVVGVCRDDGRVSVFGFSGAAAIHDGDGDGDGDLDSAGLGDYEDVCSGDGDGSGSGQDEEGDDESEGGDVLSEKVSSLSLAPQPQATSSSSSSSSSSSLVKADPTPTVTLTLTPRELRLALKEIFSPVGGRAVAFVTLPPPASRRVFKNKSSMSMYLHRPLSPGEWEANERELSILPYHSEVKLFKKTLAGFV